MSLRSERARNYDLGVGFYILVLWKVKGLTELLNGKATVKVFTTLNVRLGFGLVSNFPIPTTSFDVSIVHRKK